MKESIANKIIYTLLGTIVAVSMVFVVIAATVGASSTAGVIVTSILLAAWLTAFGVWFVWG